MVSTLPVRISSRLSDLACRGGNRYRCYRRHPPHFLDAMVSAVLHFQRLSHGDET